jgi:hypothetical protein
VVDQQDLQGHGGGDGLGTVVAVRAEPGEVVAGGTPEHKGVDAGAVVALAAQRIPLPGGELGVVEAGDAGVMATAIRRSAEAAGGWGRARSSMRWAYRNRGRRPTWS